MCFFGAVCEIHSSCIVLHNIAFSELMSCFFIGNVHFRNMSFLLYLVYLSSFCHPIKFLGTPTIMYICNRIKNVLYGKFEALYERSHPRPPKHYLCFVTFSHTEASLI